MLQRLFRGILMKSIRLTTTGVMTAALLNAGALFAQQPAATGMDDFDGSPSGPTTAESIAAPPSAPRFCDSPEHRQFDFWLGEWDVSSNGQAAGTNRIVSIHNGCALQENWQGASAGGISGTSFNLYDRARGQWHQTWVDSSGNLLQLDGTWRDGAMIMQGERPTPDGRGTALHRISWTPNDDGTVRQLWQASQDNGASWSVVFDGLYRRKPAE